MAWWQASARQRPARTERDDGESLLEQLGAANKQLASTCRTLVVAFRHLAVHAPYSELRKFRDPLDDIDMELQDGKTPSEAAARGTVGGLVQQLVHLNKSREKLLSTLVEEISSALVRGVEEAEESRAEMEEQIGAIQRATELNDIETMVQVVRTRVRDLQEALDRQRDADRQREQRLSDELGQMRGKLQRAERELQFDPLTAVCSRRWLDAFLDDQLPSAEADSMCVVMIDLDHFKDVNDGHGHDVGDKVLQAVGRCLNENILRKTDYAARFGGEEFCVLLADTDAPSGRVVADRVRAAIAALQVDVGRPTPLTITASFGVAANRPGESADEVLQRADRALYRAKEEGRDRVVID